MRQGVAHAECHLYEGAVQAHCTIVQPYIAISFNCRVCLFNDLEEFRIVVGGIAKSYWTESGDCPNQCKTFCILLFVLNMLCDVACSLTPDTFGHLEKTNVPPQRVATSSHIVSKGVTI